MSAVTRRYHRIALRVERLRREARGGVGMEVAHGTQAIGALRGAYAARGATSRLESNAPHTHRTASQAAGEGESEKASSTPRDGNATRPPQDMPLSAGLDASPEGGGASASILAARGRSSVGENDASSDPTDVGQVLMERHSEAIAQQAAATHVEPPTKEVDPSSFDAASLDDDGIQPEVGFAPAAPEVGTGAASSAKGDLRHDDTLQAGDDGGGSVPNEEDDAISFASSLAHFIGGTSDPFSSDSGLSADASARQAEASARQADPRQFSFPSRLRDDAMNEAPFVLPGSTRGVGTKGEVDESASADTEESPQSVSMGFQDPTTFDGQIHSPLSSMIAARKSEADRAAADGGIDVTTPPSSFEVAPETEGGFDIDQVASERDGWSTSTRSAAAYGPGGWQAAPSDPALGGSTAPLQQLQQADDAPSNAGEESADGWQSADVATSGENDSEASAVRMRLTDAGGYADALQTAAGSRGHSGGAPSTAPGGQPAGDNLNAAADELGKAGSTLLEAAVKLLSGPDLAILRDA